MFNYGVIVGLYDGVENLDNILKGIASQTLKPKEVLVWVNKNTNKSFDQKYYENKFPGIQIIQCNKNYGVYSRFTASYILNTEYIMVFDDDTIPGTLWAENCYHTFQTVGTAILGARGVKLTSAFEHKGYGNDTNTSRLMEVDFVGHSWVFPKSIIHYMFDEPAKNLMNGEDIQFSASAKIGENIKTYVPPQPNSLPDTHGSLYPKLGLKATRLSMLNLQYHYNSRQDVVKYWMSKGWKPLYENNR